MVYVGSGSNRTDSSIHSSNDKPVTLGYLHLSDTSDRVGGLDVSGEGSVLHSTWGQNQAVKQAASYNLLLGTNDG